MNWRARKKRLCKLSNELKKHGFFIACDDHICRVTDLNPYFPNNPRTRFEADVDGESLIDGHGRSCSLFYCAPQPLTQREAEERTEYWKQQGKMAYLKKYVYGEMTPEQEAEMRGFYAEWGWSLD